MNNSCKALNPTTQTINLVTLKNISITPPPNRYKDNYYQEATNCKMKTSGEKTFHIYNYYDGSSTARCPRIIAYTDAPNTENLVAILKKNGHDVTLSYKYHGKSVGILRYVDSLGDKKEIIIPSEKDNFPIAKSICKAIFHIHKYNSFCETRTTLNPSIAEK